LHPTPPGSLSLLQVSAHSEEVHRCPSPFETVAARPPQGEGDGCSLAAPTRHCERSEAIQSLSPDTFLDCFAALAMTEWALTALVQFAFQIADTPRILAACHARALLISSPSSEQRAQGRPGAGWHPRSTVREKTKCTAAYRWSRKQPGLPCAVGLRLMPRSPRGAELCCPRRLADRWSACPVGQHAPPQDLAPASGARTTRFCRMQAAWSCRAMRIAHGLPPCDPHRADATRVHRRSPRVS
jgi:hypothetical protein